MPSHAAPLSLAVGSLLATKLDSELVLFDALAQVLKRYLDVARASVAVLDRDRDRIEIVAVALHDAARVGKGWSIPHAGSRAGAAVDRGEVIPATLGSGVGFYEDAPLGEEGFQAAIVLPMHVDGATIGTFNVCWRRAAAVAPRDLEVLQGIALSLGTAVVRSHAFRPPGVLHAARAGTSRAAPSGRMSAGTLVQACISMQPLIAHLRAIAASDATVLIDGETGAGKGVLAAALHEWSGRRDAPFVKCDCAALVPSLVESELFGHERGAYTGADTRRLGLVEAANGGTFFLDEIAELPLAVQAKLLGVLEDRVIRRVGGNTAVPVDVRVIAATNRDLRAEVAAGRFRADLFHRLNVLAVTVPPLRRRLEDLPILAAHFARAWSARTGLPAAGLTPEALARLARHSWPGNVRELGNAVERLLVLGADDPSVLPCASPPDAPPEPPHDAGAPAADAPPAPARVEAASLAEVERRHIRSVLEETGWRVGGARGAARILGMHPNTLRSRMAKLGIWRER